MRFDQLLSALLGGTPSARVTVVKPNKPKINGNGAGNSIFNTFKKFALKYVMKHDKLKPNHPVLKQIKNANSTEQIETYLRDLDYCEDCFLKMYRSFVSSGHTS